MLDQSLAVRGVIINDQSAVRKDAQKIISQTEQLARERIVKGENPITLRTKSDMGWGMITSGVIWKQIKLKFNIPWKKAKLSVICKADCEFLVNQNK